MRKSDAMRIINILEIELKNVNKSLADTIEETVSLQEHNANLKSDVKSIFNMNADTARINDSLNETVDILEEKHANQTETINELKFKIDRSRIVNKVLLDELVALRAKSIGKTFAEMESEINVLKITNNIMVRNRDAKIKDQELEIARLSDLVNANTAAANKFDKISDIVGRVKEDTIVGNCYLCRGDIYENETYRKAFLGTAVHTLCESKL